MNEDGINPGGVIPKNPILGVERLGRSLASKTIAKPLFNNPLRLFPFLLIHHSRPNQRGLVVDTLLHNVGPENNEGN